MNILIKLAKIPARRKIFISSIISGIFFLAICTPFINLFLDISSNQKDIQYSYEQVGGVVKVNLINKSRILGTTVQISTDESSINTIFIEPRRQFDQTINITETPITIEILEIDQLNRNIKIGSILINDLSNNSQGGDNINTIENDTDSSVTSDFILRVTILSLIIWMLAFFALSHDLVLGKTVMLSFYSSLVIAPLGLLALSIGFSDPNFWSLVISIAALTLFFVVLIYFILLDVNIINISQKLEMPLEQAGRAAQFIFTLLSSYTVLILFFGADFNFFEKLLIIISFIFLITFLSLYSPRGANGLQSIIKSSSISLSIALSIFVLSIWPVNFVYAILAIAVIYYILLSLGMEFRTRLPKQVYYEYFTLVAIVIFLLLINSVWGILGTIV